MKIEFLEQAQSELEDAFNWYEVFGLSIFK